MKALLQQALEARKKLDRLGSGQFSTIDDLYNFITAVEKHCEKAEQAQPVAWAMTRSDGLLLDTITPDEHESFEGDYTTPLYTHPQLDCNDRRKVYESGFQRAWTEAQTKSAAEIADLRRQLEDARKDAERLDWMEANPESPSVPYFDITNHWLIPFLSNGAGGFGGGVGYRSYTTLRAAIDAAMKEQK